VKDVLDKKRREKKSSSMGFYGVGAFALNELLTGAVFIAAIVAGAIYIFEGSGWDEAKDKLSSKLNEAMGREKGTGTANETGKQMQKEQQQGETPNNK